MGLGLCCHGRDVNWEMHPIMGVCLGLRVHSDSRVHCGAFRFLDTFRPVGAFKSMGVSLF